MSHNTKKNGRKMNWGSKRLLAFLLALAMIAQPMLSSVGTLAYAEETTEAAAAVSDTQDTVEAPQPVAEPAAEPAAEPTAEPAAPSEDISSDTVSDQTDAVAPADQQAADTADAADAEKEKDDAEEEEEDKMPAQSFTGSVNDLIVKVSAPEGALPEETKMTVTAVDLNRVAKVAEKVVDGEVSKVRAADITFYNKEGKEIEPEKAVSVSMITSGLDTSADKAVVHIDDNWKPERVNASITPEGTAKFQTDEFSIYVVVEGVDPDARLNVNFYEADGTKLIAAMSLTKTQLDAGQMNINIYDPGVGTMESGDVFKGWTEDKNYTVEDAENGKTIDDVRTQITNLLNGGTVEDGDELNFYAMMFKSYHVSYRDELAVTIHTDEVLYKKGDTQIPYTFQFAYTPYYVTGSDEDDETKAANFDGWKQMIPEVTPTAPIYDNGDPINMADFDLSESNLTLTVMAQVAYGHWLVFNENGSGASYTEPLFVGTDETPEEAGMPNDPNRPGYGFDGWYSDSDCTIEFDPTQSITETTNVWAKWTENTDASFTVLIWEEGLSGGYDFVRSINIEDAHTGDDMAAAISGSVGDSTITVHGESVFIPMTSDNTKANAGFMYEKFDTNATDNKVTSNGTSVLNVYFERRTYTLKFYYARRDRQNRYQVPQVRTADGTAESFAGTGGNWAGNDTSQPGSSYGTAGSETRGNYTYYYRTLTAEYGEYIGDKWPTYNGTDFATWSNYRQGSWAVMRDSQAYQHDHQGTVKGKITVMDEQILGDLTDSIGNYVFANYDTESSQHRWTYHIYFKNETGGYDLYEDVAALSHDSGSNWQTQQHPPAYPGMKEVRREKVNGELIINYYYDPLSYPILFNDGVYVNGSGKTLKNNNKNNLRALQDENAVAYKTSVTQYNDYDPTSLIPDGSNYVFLGWYSDDQCSQPYTFTTMPIGGITVYAKWILKEYKVILHPQEGGDESFEYINKQPAGSYADHGSYRSDDFYVDNGEKIGNVGGTRDLYDLIGWFAKENLSQVWDFGAFTLNDTIVRRYGRMYSASEIDPRYPGSVGEINLYASWRRILDGADGIDVVYTATGKDGDGNEVIGTNAPEDPNKYSDQAQAIARPAAIAPEADPPLSFEYWVVQKWSASGYVDTDQHVYPGDRFRVNYDDAKAEEHTPTEDDPSKMHYTVQLRAQYGSAEDATPTHIYWYNNYTNSEAGIIKKNEPLAINQAIEIPTAPTRPGFEFLGWAKMPETNNDQTVWHYTYPGLGESDLFLTYDSSSEAYTYKTTGGTAKNANGVFADEHTPYDGMYAVWRENTVTIKYAVAEGQTEFGSVSNDEETIPASTGTPEGSEASPASGYAFDYWTMDDGTESISTEADFIPSKEGDVYKEHIYYAHFKEAKANVTVHHYLYGTTTKVADDTVTPENIGTQINPAQVPVATEFYDTYDTFTLTKKTTDPTATVTVVAEGVEIKLYYVLPLTIEATTDSKTYDATPLNGDFTIVGALDADSEAIKALLPEAASQTLVGSVTYPTESQITALESAITQAKPYYDVTVTPGTLTVTDGTGDDEEPVDPELVVTKSADVGPYDLDAEVTFTINATNIYEETQTITLSEIEGVTLAQSKFENVAGGATIETTATYTITEADLVAGKFVNTVTAKLGNITKEATAEVSTTEAAAQLQVTKTADKTSYKLGDTVNYTIVVTNTGNLTVKDIEVTDELTGSVDPEDKFNLAPDKSKTLTATYKVTANDVVAENIKNIAVATGTANKEEVTASGDVTVGTERIAIEITAKSDSKVYDGTALTNDGWEQTVGELADGDEIDAVTVTGSQTSVGKSANTPSGAVIKNAKGENVTAGYEITYKPGELEVTKATLPEDPDDPQDPSYDRFTVSKPEDVVYNGKEQKQPVTVKDNKTGAVLGESDISVVYTEDKTNAGTVTITISAKETGNYQGGFTRTYEIKKRSVTLVSESGSKDYDGTALTKPTVTGWEMSGDTGFVTDEVSDVKATGSVTTVAEGEVTNIITYTEGEKFKAGNYTITKKEGTLSIDPASVVVRADNKTKTYGQTDPELTYTISGGLTKEALGIDFKLERDAGEDVVGSPYTIRFIFGNAASDTTKATKAFRAIDPLALRATATMPSGDGNYEVSFTEGQLTITPAPLTITTQSASKVFDGSALTNPAATITGLVNGETATATATGSQTLVGSSQNGYSITWGTAKASNYAITENLGTLTVTAAPPTPPTPTPPTPAPTVTPTTTTTPVTTATLTPPAVIEDEPAPQATIEDKAAPKAEPEEDYWALLNLLCAIATCLISLLLLVFYFIKRKADEDEQEENRNSRDAFMNDDQEEAKRHNKLGMRLLGLIPAIGSVIAFILTEDMSLPMQWVDKWTLMMVIILAIEAALAIFSKKTTDDDEEEEQQGQPARA